MKLRVACLGILLFESAYGTVPAHYVALNQVGYLPLGKKYLFVTSSADSFRLIDAFSLAVRYRASLSSPVINDPATGLTIRRGDFSTFQGSGTFRVVTSAGDSSDRFMIADTVYNTAFRKILKSYYFQRCGMELLAQYAGPYQHTACHMSDGVFHSTADTVGFLQSTGGWHDAGDYGKYVVGAGITLGTLLMAYEYFPSRVSQDDLGIPESSNGVPDILDEVRYELEWLLTMQRTSGGVCYKLTRKQFEGFVLPQDDAATRYLYMVSTTATADFAAVMARAARLYYPYDQAFATRCGTAAIRAWSYLVANPTIIPPGGFRNPTDTNTGEYFNQDDSDERLWAAAELFVSTGDEAYHQYYLSQAGSGYYFTYPMSWGDVRTTAHLTYLRSHRAGTKDSLRTLLQSSLVGYCNTLISQRNSNGYQVILRPADYYWGSNAVSLNAALFLLLAFEQTGTEVLFETAADQLHYMFGANAHGQSFVTGVGKRTPMHPHHRLSESDGVPEPVPGLLVGGPNKNREDAALQFLFTDATPPALCYADTVPSYASNETCISWNAPLVFVLGYIAGQKVTSMNGEKRIPLPRGFRLEQNYPNPFNPSTAIRYGLPQRSHVSLAVYNMLGQQVTVLQNGEQEAGYHDVKFEASALPSGVYFYRLQAGSYTETRKLCLVR
jgi:endoglucanase